ncbi:uncharacterized protein N0V89_004288 [Didymosphaeria variabile]|uniref:Zn(2)-C6 fungal-type domain-containing protein n=1 Tax=Didymosphaeria variabile TaxID=1932322 RepID=A0A9W8XQ56_9PLEO|nr:uncharacterized protein N0V89_004288 [Didymosphaeria variabile]KAJ4356257.1 hypothetical protein N0V89_004288 [Didymosphaeria variabile]
MNDDAYLDQISPTSAGEARDTHAPTRQPPLTQPLAEFEQHIVHNRLGTYANHLTDAPSRKRPRPTKSRPDVAYARKRATAACNLCRSRKIKCNNARPSCSACVAASSMCVYGDPQDQSSILILDRLNQVLSKLDHIDTPTTPSTSAATRTTLGLQSTDLQANALTLQDQSDQLKIPSRRTTADAVLKWPVFQNRWPANYLTNAIFEAENSEYDSDLDIPPPQEQTRSKLGIGGVDEDSIPYLVRRFIELVHIKNPILDVKTISAYANHVAESGLGWDPPSCLVVSIPRNFRLATNFCKLVACALGCVAESFDIPPGSSTNSLERDGSRLHNAEAYYNMARKRFGFLDTGVLVSQCHFLAGVYLMYTLRPLLAWTKFQEASRSYHLYLQCQLRRPPHVPADSALAKRRALEQRLYWSCYKSECELRVELDLPNSSLADFNYPDMHPSPPNLESVDEPSPQMTIFEDGHYRATNHDSLHHLREQQQQSWFYYLTEITLRRITNNVLNMLYADSYVYWSEQVLRSKRKAAEEFNEQLLNWYGLGSEFAFQPTDRSYFRYTSVPDQIRFNEEEFHCEELPYMIQIRFVHLQSIIGLPFLYHAIHSPPNAPCQSIVQPLAQQAVNKCIRQISNIKGSHRHHGTWNWTRSNTTSALVVIASATSSNVTLPPDWKHLVRNAIEQLRFWEAERSGLLSRAIEVLENALHTHVGTAGHDDSTS